MTDIEDVETPEPADSVDDRQRAIVTTKVWVGGRKLLQSGEMWSWDNQTKEAR